MPPPAKGENFVASQSATEPREIEGDACVDGRWFLEGRQQTLPDRLALTVIFMLTTPRAPFQTGRMALAMVSPEASSWFGFALVCDVPTFCPARADRLTLRAVFPSPILLKSQPRACPMATTNDRQIFHDIRFRVRDGLQLYGRHYPAASDRPGRPALCLPGLTRNSRDFDRLATFLSLQAETRRDVFTIDFRGRGSSDWDSDWKNYTVPMEALDVIDFATVCGLHDAALIGTSRGGLVTMVLAAMQPGLIGCAVLNDIGPELDSDGLMRIASYVGKTPLPANWSEAADLVKAGNRKQFPKLDDTEWDAFARRLFNEKDGRPTDGYDPQLGNAFSVLDGPMPPIWPQFDALLQTPLLVLRGELTDLLSMETADEMCRRHPNASLYTVHDEGHAPLLDDLPTLERIATFLAETDASQTTA